MSIDRAAEEPARVRRALQRLSVPGSLGGVTLAANSGLQIVGDQLSIDIGQNPSLLLLDAAGLETQYVTATGAGANVGVLTASTGSGQIRLAATATGNIRLDVNGADTFLNVTDTAAQFGSGGTSYIIDSTNGLLGIIDASSAAIFRIEDSAIGAPGIQLDSSLCAITGFYANFADGTPILVQPQQSSAGAPEVRVQGANGDSIVGGAVVIQGGTALTAVNTNAGLVTVTGGIPTGSGTSRVLVRAQTAAPASVTGMEVSQVGGAARLGFYAATPVAQQSVNIQTSAIHAALVALGLITSSGTTVSDAPAGLIAMWGAAAAPTGWQLCDGSAISRTTFATLFAVIGTTYGVGDGTTTFNVPDMRQRFPIGKAAAGTGSALAATGGTIDHTHNVDIASFNSGVDGDAGGRTALLGGVANVALFAHTHPVDPPSTASDANNPPYLVVNFIVKT